MEPIWAPGPPGISRRDLLTAAAVPASQRFDLGKESHDLWRNKSPHQKTVMQSFTFDHVFLNGFGHAVSIGVEPSGSASILWLETGPIITVGDPPIFGEYLYVLDGDAYDDKTNPPPGNAHVSSVSFNGGSATRVPTNAGGTLTWREPEGMAVYRTDAGEARLFLGFASGDTGARRANLFYKNVLV